MNVFDDKDATLRVHRSNDAEETITNVPRKLNGFCFRVANCVCGRAMGPLLAGRDITSEVDAACSGAGRRVAIAGKGSPLGVHSRFVFHCFQMRSVRRVLVIILNRKFRWVWMR
jgi:hypothetical protein